MHQLEFGMLLFNKTQKFLLYRIFGFWLTFSIFFKSSSFVLEAFPGQGSTDQKVGPRGPWIPVPGVLPENKFW